jgi:small-conductance mechanosensitive channel
MGAAVNKREIGAGLVVLVIGVVFLLWSQAYPARMSAMPKLVGWVTIVLALIDIAAHFDNALGRILRQITGLEIGTGSGQRDEAAAPSWRKIVVAMIWVVGYVVVIDVFGFLATTPVYIFLYMFLHGRKSLRASALSAVVTTLAIWFTFEYLFHYPLYPGLLFAGQ